MTRHNKQKEDEEILHCAIEGMNMEEKKKRNKKKRREKSTDLEKNMIKGRGVTRKIKWKGKDKECTDI